MGLLNYLAIFVCTRIYFDRSLIMLNNRKIFVLITLSSLVSLTIILVDLFIIGDPSYIYHSRSIPKMEVTKNVVVNNILEVENSKKTITKEIADKGNVLIKNAHLQLLPKKDKGNNWIFNMQQVVTIKHAIRHKITNILAAEESLKEKIKSKRKTLSTVIRGTAVPNQDSKQKFVLTTNDIYWSAYAETLVPKGVTSEECLEFMRKVRSQSATTIVTGKHSTCGRPMNAFVTLKDGTHMCARCKSSQLKVYAEALSFYLARLLNVDSVPPVTLVTSTEPSTFWRNVNISDVSWRRNQSVALVKWITNGYKANSFNITIPSLILQAYWTMTPITSSLIHTSNLRSKNHKDIAAVIQWTTMIVFDYLTGTIDRLIVWQLHGSCSQQNQTGPEPYLHNFLISNDGKYWLTDNESAFFYLYQKLDPNWTNRHFGFFQNHMLRVTCIFQYSVIKALQTLSQHPSPFQKLLEFSRKFEPLLFEPLLINLDSERISLAASWFRKRVSSVLQWFERCKTLDTFSH